MRILMVLPSFPFPPDTGGAIRTLELVRRLGRKNEVDILALDQAGTGALHIDQLQSCCRHVHLAPVKRRAKAMQIPALAVKVLRRIPLDTKYAESKSFAERLTHITRENAYDLIHFEKSVMAIHFGCLSPKHTARTVLGLQDVGVFQLYRMCRRERNAVKKVWLWLNCLAMMDWEPKVARQFDRTLVVSEVDRVLLQALDPQLDVAVIPNGVDTRACRPFPLGDRDKNILIVGSMDYPPNIDAALHFHKRIYPLIRRRIPDCTLSIVGRNPPASVRRLGDDSGVTVSADVAEVRPYYQRARVSAVPLRSGGGTRLKILESMAFGTPVVSTRVGCEGLAVEDGRNILVADSPADFARRICDVIQSASQWQALSQAGRQLVEEQYDWDTAADLLQGVYERLARDTETRRNA